MALRQNIRRRTLRPAESIVGRQGASAEGRREDGLPLLMLDVGIMTRLLPGTAVASTPLAYAVAILSAFVRPSPQENRRPKPC